MMDILFLIERFYPNDGATSNCVFNLCQALLLRGVQPRVLCLKALPSEPTRELFQGVHIERLSVPEYYHFKALDGNFSSFARLSVAAKKLLHKIQRSLSHAEVDISLKNAFVRRARLLGKEQPLNGIVAVSGIFETALGLSELTSVNCPLLFYQVDPYFSNSLLSTSQKAVKRRMKQERIVYKTSACVFTTPILAKENSLNGIAKGCNVKAVQFPNIRLLPVPSVPFSWPGTIHCMFSGFLSVSVRDPAYVWRLFSGLPDDSITLSIFGPSSASLLGDYASLNQTRIFFYPSIPLEESLQRLQQADILINIGNNSQNQVPSKIFDYMSAGRPIINFYKHENCPSLPYLEKYPCCLNLYENDSLEKNRDLFFSFCAQNFKTHVPFSYVKQHFAEHTADYLATLFLEQLQAVSSSSSEKGCRPSSASCP